MPSALHRAVHDLLHDTPALAVRLALPGLDPPPPVTVVSPELSPAALTADLALLLGGEQPTHGILVEIQLRRDEDKRFVWPAYVGLMRRRHRVPVTLLVVTTSAKVARWAAQPIALDGHGSTLRPVVVGPAQLPVILNADEAAQDVDLAALAAIAHADHPQRQPIAEAVLGALRGLSPAAAFSYHQLLGAALGPFIQDHPMLQPYRVYLPETQAMLDDARQEGEQRGRIEGERRGRIEGERRGLRFGWAARFGGAPLPPELDAVLAQADLPALLRAAPALLAAPDPEAAAEALRVALAVPEAARQR
jgi:hypothetical protein